MRIPQEFTRFCKVRFHSSTVLAGSHEVLRLRGGPGWFEVRLYEGFRVPQHSARAVGPEVSQGSTKLCKDSTQVPQGSTMLHEGCVGRPSSEKPSDQDRFSHGRNSKQNRNQWLLAHFHCFVTCSLAQANVGFVANQITSLRNSRCSRVNAWHCCLVCFGLQELRFTGTRLHCRGPPDCTVWARSAPIAPSHHDWGPTQSGPVNCTKLASPSFAIDTVAIRTLRKTGVEL